MAVITLTISESEQQIVSGIPKTIYIEANIPSTIFYTLDGTEPTTSSAIYVGPITLPTNDSGVTFKVFATNGTDESVIVTELYAPDISTMRRPRAGVTGLSPMGQQPQNRFPYGGNAPAANVQYNTSGGITVDAPDTANVADGYDGDGGLTGGSDLARSEYNYIYSDRNRLGEYGDGIGTLPAEVTIRVPEPENVSSSSNSYDKYFNPRAMVIYQDSSIAPYDPNMSQLNREFFSLANAETSREGAQYRNSSLQGNNVTGSFIRSQFNASDNTMTYYYRDNETGRWIISKEKFQPNNPNIGQLSKIVLSRNEGAGMVFKWVPFMSRHLR